MQVELDRLNGEIEQKQEKIAHIEHSIRLDRSRNERVYRLERVFVRTSKKLISSTQAMGTRGGGTSGSWFPGKPETPQKRHGKGCGGTPFSMPFLLSH